MLLIENVGSVDHITPLLPVTSKSCLAVVTSRKDLSLDIALGNGTKVVTLLHLSRRMRARVFWTDEMTCVCMCVRTETTLSVKLGAMTARDATQLMWSLLPHASTDEAHELARLCGNLPLPIRLIGGVIRRKPNLTLPAMIKKLEKYSLPCLPPPLPLILRVLGDLNCCCSPPFTRPYIAAMTCS
jgi:hypothetical protein